MKIIHFVTWKLEMGSLIFVKNCGENFSITVYTIFNYGLCYIYRKNIDQYLKNHDRVGWKNRFVITLPL